MDSLLEQFLVEARENLAFIDQNIDKIGGDDPELLNSVFRAAHTLKGGSGIVGFEAVKRITHHAEDLLDMLRAGKIEFREEMVESLYNAFDEVVNLVEAAEESGGIVECDEERIDEIAQELSGLMGKKIEILEWSCPFTVSSDMQRIVNLPMSFLRNFSTTIPFSPQVCDESFCAQEQLYAVIFDIDQSCMVYGNDPIYTLSLIADKVVGVYSCMSDESCVSILSGIDDPEGLLLKISIVAFVYASYDEINDALFNFNDELTYLPLDIETLLSINIGEGGHVLDVLKELARITMDSPTNRDEMVRNIHNALPLIGAGTLQNSQLNRILDVLGMVEDMDMPKLAQMIAQVPYGDALSAHFEVPMQEVEAVSDNVQVVVEEKITLSQSARAQLGSILSQQLQTLEAIEDPEAFERVREMLTYFLSDYLDVVPTAFETRETLMQWLRQELGLESSREGALDVQGEVVGEEIADEEIAQIEELVIPEFVSPPEVIVETIATPKVRASATVEAANNEEKGGSKKGVVGKTVKVDQESIDHLMNVVGELLVAKNSLPYLADGVHTMTHEGTKRAIMEKYTFINRLTEQLQDLIMGMRMLPISYVFDRYPKLVRDISKNLGKKVSLTMDGQETKLDKNMIEMLADPMIHIMRNSLDHGIETPEVRAQKGKNPEGAITLNAYAQSDKIVVEIRDDGAGINVDRVIQKVLEKGLLTHEQIDAMNDDEQAALVMLPGLSTAETITEYSGRGVGMDVVRKSIEAFGGNIRIKTVPNQGTTIYLTIPMSLAVTSLLHVMLSNVHYGFPMDSVSETVKIDKNSIEYLQNEPFIYLRGEVIPLLFAKGMLDDSALEGRALPVVVLNIKGNLLAVVVNDLLGQLEVVQKPLEGIMENHPIFSGTALLGNGQIIMAIDPMGLLGLSHELQSNYQHAS